jgi:hypothetical protein
VLAHQTPVIRSGPAQTALQLTNLPKWLWIDPAEWVPESKTATVPGESVTATATPVSVTWHPGDGSTARSGTGSLDCVPVTYPGSLVYGGLAGVLRWC